MRRMTRREDLDEQLDAYMQMSAPKEEDAATSDVYLTTAVVEVRYHQLPQASAMCSPAGLAYRWIVFHDC